MISFALVAYNANGEMIDGFYRNVLPIKGGIEDPETMDWWATQPNAWAETQKNRVTSKNAMDAAVTWIKSTCIEKTRPCMICFPSAFDNTFWRYYVMTFIGSDPFRFNCIDGASFAMGKFGLSRREASLKKLYAKFLTEEERANHTHYALSDAETQGLLYFRMKAN